MLGIGVIRFLLWAPASLIAPAHAEEALKISLDAPLTYTVKRGDTLWDIAALFLRDPWQWPELWALNTQVDNPHLIYPGDQLTLVWEAGQPRLVRAAQGDVRLSPTLRASPPDTAIPAISRQHIAPFLRQHFVIDAGALEQAPYVVAGGRWQIAERPGRYGVWAGGLAGRSELSPCAPGKAT